MSRIGKKEIELPGKVEVTVQKNVVKAKGPKGSLEKTLPEGVTVKVENNKVNVVAVNSKPFWGLARTMISNMVNGVSVGFSKDLEFTGVGYRAAVSGNVLTLNLGYSHPIDYKIPAGIEVKVNKNVISVLGSDKELVGLVSADIRSFREPEPYKGKGIKYVEEKIIRKAGKTAAKK
jgi:large subunit ribosomal protein L6